MAVKAVIVPDLDQLPGEAAARHELAGIVELKSANGNTAIVLPAGPVLVRRVAEVAELIFFDLLNSGL